MKRSRTGLTFVTPSPTDSTCSNVSAKSWTRQDQTHNSTTFVTQNHGKRTLFEPVSHRSHRLNITELTSESFPLRVYSSV